MWLKSKGVIKYDPPRPDLRENRKGISRNKWWCIIDIPDSITTYYRYWVERTYHLDLEGPPYGAHITIIGGTEPDDSFKQFWKYNDGVWVDFEYQPIPDKLPESYRRAKRLKPHWFIPARTQVGPKIRSMLGFKPDYPWHITIGREKW